MNFGRKEDHTNARLQAKLEIEPGLFGSQQRPYQLNQAHYLPFSLSINYELVLSYINHLPTKDVIFIAVGPIQL